jgi:hypothetical protein
MAHDDPAKQDTFPRPSTTSPVTPQPDTTPDPRAWLEQFPPERRSPIANWFHLSIRSGVSVPAAVLVAVEATVQRRLAWRKDQDDSWLHLVLARLQDDRGRAMAYAQSVINYEALPPAARQRVKAERSVASLKDAMRGKTVTPAQRAYLSALGYTGPAPHDRAAASHLIDQLKSGGAR